MVRTLALLVVLCGLTVLFWEAPNLITQKYTSADSIIKDQLDIMQHLMKERQKAIQDLENMIIKSQELNVTNLKLRATVQSFEDKIKKLEWEVSLQRDRIKDLEAELNDSEK